MLLRRASLTIWQGFEGGSGGSSGSPAATFGMFFLLSCKAERFIPPAASLGSRSVLIFDVFSCVTRRVPLFQILLMRCATELVVGHRRERWSGVCSLRSHSLMHGLALLVLRS